MGVFQEGLKAYIRMLLKLNLDIQENLSNKFSAFLSYRDFTFDQAKLFLIELPGLDLRKRIDSKSPIEQAARFCNQEVITYLESLLPAHPIQEFNLGAIDYSQFSGLPELKGRITTSKSGAIQRLTTLEELYHFIEENPTVEGDQSFFQNQIEFQVKLHK